MINLSTSQLIKSGFFGHYFRISKTKGVKIYKHGGYKTTQIDLSSKLSQRIIQEATIGVLAQSTTKEISIVKYKSKYYLGIIQKHVATKIKTNKKDIKTAKSMLFKKDIAHSDLHEGNLLKTKSNIYVIDFDPTYSRFVGKKTTYYTIKNKLIKQLKSEILWKTILQIKKWKESLDILFSAH